MRRSIRIETRRTFGKIRMILRFYGVCFLEWFSGRWCRRKFQVKCAFFDGFGSIRLEINSQLAILKEIAMRTDSLRRYL